MAVSAPPLRDGAPGGVWADLSHRPVPAVRLPLALAALHRAVPPWTPVHLRLLTGDDRGDQPSDDDGGRSRFASWPEALADVLEGAGFVVDSVAADADVVQVSGTRARSLPDTVGPGMRLLVCGLNPSEYAADRGVGYARPGNRFWPAALDAGLLTRSHDPGHALRVHGVGMTDLVKRATPRASELGRDEYRSGRARVERLVRWLQPGAVCFVGLDGWRKAVDAGAVAGVQPVSFGGRPAYVMPSTSGLNAHASREELTAHLRAAGQLAG
ncbi:MAG: mismatch-specific DNA-glycosylase [Actinomycetota bacterium]|nr:mismatch-specific DNA-glycosylase [Actinomycetota bacterium]